ncbi:lipopolysaccharide biosynthesis protein [Halovenus sp. HT40]|uniref:lipopolysaccharide biosynthesis protein n=1 Tax=Halovenus sp. HT40 TaxID=3126691 RepID=UPI00300EA86C
MIQDIRSVAVAEVISRAVSIITIPLLTRLLIPTEYGVYRSLLLAIGILSLHGYLNLHTIVRKRLSQVSHPESQHLITTVLITVIVLLGLAAGAIIVGSDAGIEIIPTASKDFINNNQILVFFLVISYPSYSVGLAILTGIQRFTAYAIIKSGTEILMLLSLLLLAFINNISIPAVVSVLAVLRTLSSFIIISLISDELSLSFTFSPLIQQIQSISIPLLPRVLIKRAETIGPDVVILTIFGPATYAAWSILFTFDRVFQLIARPPKLILLPKLSEKVTQNEEVGRVLEQFYLLSSVLVLPIIVGGWLIGDKMVNFIFGSGYTLGKYTTAVVISAFGISVLTTSATQYYIANDDSRYETISGIAGGIIYGLLLFTGIYLQNITIIGLGLVGSWLVRLIIGIEYQNRKSNMRFPSPVKIVKLGVALGMMSIAVLATQEYISSVPHLILVIAGGGSGYFIALFLLGFFRPQEITQLYRDIY